MKSGIFSATEVQKRMRELAYKFPKFLSNYHKKFLLQLNFQIRPMGSQNLENY